MTEELHPKTFIDLDAARARLQQDGPARMWRSLEELSGTPESRDYLAHEFPKDVENIDNINRRDVLKLMAASAAMAGLSACTKLPTEKIVPYVNPPEQIIPGRPLFYASSYTHGGSTAGVLVESHTGRPTKIEGNPEHPGRLGSTDLFAQASILSLYDPDRSQAVIFDGRVTSWADFSAHMASQRTSLASSGAGVRILTETVVSPTLGAQIRSLLAAYPMAKWHQYEPSSGDSAREGARLAFGKPVSTVYHFDLADVVLALDADFLNIGAGHVRYARDFSSRRDLSGGAASNLTRLYAVESMTTATGALADHRLPLRSSEVEALARQL